MLAVTGTAGFIFDGNGMFTGTSTLRPKGKPNDTGRMSVRSTRRWVMVQSHILPVVAVIAVFWARGW